MNKLHNEMGHLGRLNLVETELHKKQKECDQLTEACSKMAGALEFTISILVKLAEQGSELAKASLESLNTKND